MRPYFKRSSEIATSSSVEAEFGDLKNRGFEGKLPIRIDKFVFQHLDLLDAKTTLISNEKDISAAIPLQLDKDIDRIYNKNSEPSLEKSSDSVDISLKNDSIKYNIDDTDSPEKLNVSNVSDVHISNENENCIWNTCENWYGLVKSTNDINEPDDIIKGSQELPKLKPKKRYKPTYLDKCPEWDYLKNIKSFNLPLIINGSKCKPLHMKREQLLTVQETCAFDSLLQIIASGIAANI